MELLQGGVEGQVPVISARVSVELCVTRDYDKLKRIGHTVRAALRDECWGATKTS